MAALNNISKVVKKGIGKAMIIWQEKYNYKAEIPIKLTFIQKLYWDIIGHNLSTIIIEYRYF